VSLTAAEVNSGVTIHSSYGGTAHPVNVLTLTGINQTAGEFTAAASTITITDPPVSTSPAVVQSVTTAPIPAITQSPPAATSNTAPALMNATGLPTANGASQTLAVAGGNTVLAVVLPGGSRPDVAATGSQLSAADGENIEVVATTVNETESENAAAIELPVAASETVTNGEQLAATKASPIIPNNPNVLKSLDREAQMAPAGTPSGEARKMLAMVGPLPSASDLTAALFVGGIIIPRAVLRTDEQRNVAKAPAGRRRPRVLTFDLADDRFDGPAGPPADAADLPPVIETSGEGVEWSCV
jgi:hypothetical protein